MEHNRTKIDIFRNHNRIYSRIWFIHHRFICHFGIFITFPWYLQFFLSSPCILLQFIRHQFIQHTGIFVTFSNRLEQNSIIFHIGLFNNYFFDCLALDHNNNWHGGSNGVSFSVNKFDEINNKETKKNLPKSVVLGNLTRFSSGFRVWLDSKTVDGIY